MTHWYSKRHYFVRHDDCEKADRVGWTEVVSIPKSDPRYLEYQDRQDKRNKEIVRQYEQRLAAARAAGEGWAAENLWK